MKKGKLAKMATAVAVGSISGLVIGIYNQQSILLFVVGGVLGGVLYAIYRKFNPEKPETCECACPVVEEEVIEVEEIDE